MPGCLDALGRLVEQETCLPALENLLRSQKHPVLQAGANPRCLTSFNEIKYF